ncbi:uncharacterized protein LOC121757800 [Salvia splendens]|uniref:uncharacterized protein LOC121757800 n=1 Tax=Salvia splendens TaxID=180675 RepID=UPI001C26D130|nr:uncharacterized protein LOC121757800 [Salvia splendens]
MAARRGNGGGANHIQPAEDFSSPYYLHPSDNPGHQLVSQEIWVDLRYRFSQCDSARIYQLKQRIMSLTQGDDDINGYFTNLRIVWDEYKHTQPISWCIRSHILSMVPLPNLSKAFSLVLQEERQRTIGGIDSSRYNQVLPPSSSEQPYSTNAAASSYYNRGRVCSHCGKTNRTVDKCFSLHGYPPSFGKGKFKQSSNSRDYSSPKSVNFVDNSITDSNDKVSVPSSMPTFDQCQQLITLLQSQLATGSLSIPTSAAPQNSSPIQSPSPPFTVRLPNGSTVPIIHIGTICLTPTITLHSVLEPSQAIVIGNGRRLGNLYTLDVNSKQDGPQAPFASTSSHTSLHVSHSTFVNSVVNIDV